MKEWDVVLLTQNCYVDPTEQTESVQNILKEDALLQEALEKQGFQVCRKAWDDKHFDWSLAHALLFRATWDYFERIEEFKVWLQEVRTQSILINPAPLIDWNLDKHYLFELQEKGIRIPNTLLLEKGSPLTLKEQYAALQVQGTNDKRCVLKPCISGGAWQTYLIEEDQIDDYEEIYRNLIAKDAFLLQEFQFHVPFEGERSYMVFGGQFSHAVLKMAKSGDFRVQDDFGGSLHQCNPTKEEQEIAMKVVEACPFEVLYARVDLFKDNENEWALAEIELIEPELWFRKNNLSAPLLASAVKNFIDEKTT